MGGQFFFFSTESEIHDLWNWVAKQPSMKLIEDASRPGKINREFASYPIQEYMADRAGLTVAIWPKTAGGIPTTRKIKFNWATRIRLRALGRSYLECPTFIRIHMGGHTNPGLIPTNELRYETEKLASRGNRYSASQISSIDWNEHQRLVGQIKSHLRKSAVAVWNGAPVSKGVADVLQSSDKQLWLWGKTGSI